MQARHLKRLPFALTSHFSLERVRMCEFARLKCEVIALSLSLSMRVCMYVSPDWFLYVLACVHAYTLQSIPPLCPSFRSSLGKIFENETKK